jgi:hypothetical protein
MFSSQWAPWAVFVLRLAALIAGLVTAGVAWRAAAPWLAASKVEIEDTTPRTQVSWDDNPALGVLEAVVAGNATQTAYSRSSALNARAARWTAAAAILTGIVAILGAL